MGSARGRRRGPMRYCFRSIFTVLAIVIGSLLPQTDSLAQQGGNGGLSSLLSQLSPDQLQQIIQSNPGLTSNLNGQITIPPTLTPQVQTLSPSTSPSPSLISEAGKAPQPPEAEKSDIEALMSARAKTPLKLFGYDQLGMGGTVSQAQVGAVQGSYILGSGDQLDVTLRGQENSEFIVTIDRDGRVTLPKLAPVSAAGRSLNDVRQDILNAIHKAYMSTQGYVTVAQIRQVSVLVVGQVNNPGQQTLTGLSTILDALNLAGGIKKTGSLRNVVIIRNGRPFRLDLYTILMAHRTSPDLTVAQGDRIIVPSIGPTVAVAGNVRRPGIYELPPGTRAISQREVEALGNGTVVRGAYRDMVLRIRVDGKEELVDTTGKPGTPIRDGEILFVKQAVKVALGEVTLTGAVRLPGLYALDRAKTLHDLLPNMDVFQPNPYMLLGVIQRTDPQTRQRTLVPFSPLHVVQGKENMDLINDDTVMIFDFDEMRQFAQSLQPGESQASMAQQQAPGNASSQMPNIVEPNNSSNQNSASANAQNIGLSSLGVPVQLGQGAGGGVASGGGASNSAGLSTSGAGIAAGQGQTGGTDSGGSLPTSALAGLSQGDLGYLGAVLQNDHIYLDGAVRLPGDFLAAPGTTLGDVLSAAGGLTSDADLSGFEVTSTIVDNASGISTTKRETYHIPPNQYASLVLRPLDAITFHHVFTDRIAGTVTINGQVRYPGQYTLLRGERLSEVLVRAGGLTNVAYPYGTVFLRDSLKRLEHAAHSRMADDLEEQLITSLGRASGQSSAEAQPGAAALSQIQLFIGQYKEQPALGRMSIIADPSVLAANPQQDPLMEPGDTVFIPQRPSTVTVVGAVMQPGSYPFEQHAGGNDYIDRAGGLGSSADADHIFVVFPDGTARKLDQSWGSFTSVTIPPGSVIYVPRDILPTNWYAITSTIASIFQSLAVSAASLTVISRN